MSRHPGCASRRALGASIVLFCSSACGGGAVQDDHGLRHVVFISVDTLRADHVGCYGHPYVESPTIDRLAQEGVRFEQCISTAPTTLSSHTSLFTGTYAHTHGVARNGYAVHDDNEMLPEILSQHGFRTAGFAGAAPLDTDVNFDQGFDHYDTTFSVTDGQGIGEGRYQRPANEVTTAVLNWLDAGGAPSRKSDRLFLFVHYYDVHSPYRSPEPFAGMYRTDELDLDGEAGHLRKVRKRLSDAGIIDGRSREDSEDGFAARVAENDAEALEQARILEAEYCAGITWTDSQLEVLIEGLRERGILDEALLVLTADHGETFYEHANVFKHGNSVYETEVWVPLIVRFPDGRYAGLEVDRLTSGVDVLPTLLGLLGIEGSEVIEGEDIGGVFGGTLPARGPVYSEATKPFSDPRYHDDPVWPNRRKFQSIRTDRYKYMFRIPDEQYRLYDLSADPAETRNLLLEEREYDRAEAADLEAALRIWRDVAAPRRTGMVDSEGQQNALNALGYGASEEQDGEQDEADDPGGDGGGDGGGE